MKMIWATAKSTEVSRRQSPCPNWANGFVGAPAARDAAAREQQQRDAALKQAEARFQAQLAAQQEEHRRQLANVRAGVVTPLTTAEVTARHQAAQLFDAGVRLFTLGFEGPDWDYDLIAKWLRWRDAKNG